MPHNSAVTVEQYRPAQAIEGAAPPAEPAPYTLNPRTFKRQAGNLV